MISTILEPSRFSKGSTSFQKRSFAAKHMLYDHKHSSITIIRKSCNVAPVTAGTACKACNDAVSLALYYNMTCSCVGIGLQIVTDVRYTAGIIGQGTTSAGQYMYIAKMRYSKLLPQNLR